MKHEIQKFYNNKFSYVDNFIYDLEIISHICHRSSVVERVLGKHEVPGSIPGGGFIKIVN